METTINRIILLAMIVGMIILTSLMLTQKSFGSVNDSSAGYESTTTRTGFFGVSNVASPSVLSLGFGTLGSVVITGASSGVTAGIINFYDGTTTSNHSDSATTTLASIPGGTAAGTYTYDVKYTKGLIIEIIGTVGTSTITWKK